MVRFSWVITPRNIPLIWVGETTHLLFIYKQFLEHPSAIAKLPCPPRWMLADHLMPHLQGWHWIHQQHHGENTKKWKVWKTGKNVEMKPVGFDSYTILGLVIYCVDDLDVVKLIFVVVPFCRRMGDFSSGEGAGKVFVKIVMVKIYLHRYSQIFKWEYTYTEPLSTPSKWKKVSI